MSKAPKRRGLSMEEKVSRVEEWFLAHPTPYTLRDLLLVLPKATGVIPQSIEECLELLVAESRIRQKKIGVHVLFWRFPKTAAQQLAAAFDTGGSGGAAAAAKYTGMGLPQLQKEVRALEAEEAEARRRVQGARAEIGDAASVQRDSMKARQLQEEVKALRAELGKMAAFDPAMIERVKAATTAAWEAANRWTDNLYLLEHHISQRMGVAPRELRMRLQLPADVDYVEFDELARDNDGKTKAATTAPEGAAAAASPPRGAEEGVAGEPESPPPPPAAEAADTPAALGTCSPHERAKRGRGDGVAAVREGQTGAAKCPRKEAKGDAVGHAAARRGRKKKES
ncbi:uncharacterized protein Tco025E_07966 [Trypanosoma conorhini]|uniref:Mnd1 HTH domain-containing protein n=1 Tax=Trypanosoma conorhini TaxID=83891 RepID=A0A422NGJ3_9TRYP|nr:uncharacterized protein Tco025E_07966 [Trypanosoma conorhini]RNF04559.1 hypothetical protein Tco025E_07966 [Trypanosoma conorhini]